MGKGKKKLKVELEPEAKVEAPAEKPKEMLAKGKYYEELFQGGK